MAATAWTIYIPFQVIFMKRSIIFWAIKSSTNKQKKKKTKRGTGPSKDMQRTSQEQKLIHQMQIRSNLNGFTTLWKEDT